MEMVKGFNLLALLDKELKEKNITDKTVIKDYLYQRCGQIFKVDPKGAFCTPEERKVLNEQRIDIRNVTNVYLNCYSWSYAFVDLLKNYMIPAKVVIMAHENKKEPEKTKTHAYVEAYIGGETFLLDLYGNYEDIYRTKFNFEPFHNAQISNNYQHRNTYVNRKEKKDSMEIFLKELEQKLEEMKNTKEEYVYQAFKLVASIVNSDTCQEKQLDYITGMRFISILLLRLVGRYKNFHYYNMNEGIYIELYQLSKKGKNIYFVYQKVENENYKLLEVSENFVSMLEQNYDYTEGHGKTRKLVNTRLIDYNLKKAQ